jgi:NAD-dependent histone deacetylase SIR2
MKSRGNLQEADLLIIAGTSLTVYPFAALANMTSEKCPRILINLESVGDLGRKPDDVLLLGQCDAMIEELSKALGWHEELLELWDATRLSVTEPKAVDSAKDEVEELAEQLVSKVKLGEDEVAKKAPEPDTDLTDPSKPSIRSGDKVGSKPEKETSKETPEPTGPSEPRPRNDDKDESKEGEPEHSISGASQGLEQVVNTEVAEGKL